MKKQDDFSDKLFESSFVYLIQPLDHGNGGWYGSEIVTQARLETLLNCNPYEEYREIIGPYDEYSSPVRICLSANPNDSIYIYNPEEFKWEKR